MRSKQADDRHALMRFVGNCARLRMWAREMGGGGRLECDEYRIRLDKLLTMLAAEGIEATWHSANEHGDGVVEHWEIAYPDEVTQ
jgi:hypothetical protein